MPTRKKSKLGILAGSGILPAQLVQACQKQSIEPVIIGFKGYTDHVTPDYWGRIGSSTKILNYLQENNVRDIVMIGAIKRPSFFDLWPDWATFKFFLKAWLKSFGDDGLLKAARYALEARGFQIHGIHEYLPDLLMPEGILSTHPPLEGHQIDVQVGIQAARQLGREDKGQAVLVKNGQVIAQEDVHGTSVLIQNHGQVGAILVKMRKPQQDKDLDLPTVGPQTVELCAAKQMAGIVGQAQNTLLVERMQTIQLANQNGLFVLGVTIDE